MKIPFKREKTEIEKRHLPTKEEFDKKISNKSGKSLLRDPKILDPSNEIPLDPEIVRIITNNGNEFGLSNITEDDRNKFFYLLSFDKLCLSNEEMDDEEISEYITSTYLNLTRSLKGWGVEKVTELRRGLIQLPEQERRQ